MMKFFVLSIPIVFLPFFAGCSLSHDLAMMDDPSDFTAYANKWAPSEDAFLAVQRVAKPLLDKKDWNGAIAIFEQFEPKFPEMKKRFDAIIGMLRAPSANLEIKNLGTGINTTSNEIKPAVTTDGSRMYFASDRPGGKGELDIYVSKLENGVWQLAQNLGDRINTPDHETINGLSFDGTSILLYVVFRDTWATATIIISKKQTKAGPQSNIYLHQ